MAHHDAADIIPVEQLYQSVLMGRVSEITRGIPCAEVGDTFDVKNGTYKITEMTERTVEDLTVGDAQREQAMSRERFLQRIAEDVPGELTPNTAVYHYQFQPDP